MVFNQCVKFRHFIWMLFCHISPFTKIFIEVEQEIAVGLIPASVEKSNEFPRAKMDGNPWREPVWYVWVMGKERKNGLTTNRNPLH